MKIANLILSIFILVSSSRVMAQASSDVFPAAPLVQRILGRISCENMQDEFWNDLYKVLDERKQFPAHDDVLKPELIKQLRQKGINTDQDPGHSLVKSTVALYYYVTHKVPEVLQVDMTLKDRDSLLAAIKSFELGTLTVEGVEDGEGEVAGELNHMRGTVQKLLADINQRAIDMKIPCTIPKSTARAAVQETVKILKDWKRRYFPPVFGIHKTMSVAYQSCYVSGAAVPTGLKVPPVSPTGTKALEGFGKTGQKYPDGRGEIRAISNPTALLASHPYLKQTIGSKSCNARENPMMYNYGNKPKASTDATSKLDFFTPSLSQATYLGTDCSGFVVTSLAVAGLKLRSKSTLKAYDVYGVSSSMLIDPPRNGLDCFEPLTFTKAQTLMAGDVIAGEGHVVMVSAVSNDSFGIRKAIAAGRVKTAKDCTADKLKASDFSFTIAHSGPVLNGVGISRLRARDYFGKPAGDFMGKYLVSDFATKACLAYFGAPQAATPGKIGVSRHTGYKFDRTIRTASCVDTPIQLEREECLRACTKQ